MADIFISYARADRDKIERLAAALEGEGYSVWWDRNIVGGSEFSEEIEKELDAAKAVIVAWSETSVKSRWVRDEAGSAAEAAKLIPVSIDGVHAPMGFKQYHAIDMHDWNGKPDGHGFDDVSRAVKARLTGEAPAPAAKARKKRLPVQGPHSSVYIVGIVALAILAIVWIQEGPQSRPDRSSSEETATAPEASATEETESDIGATAVDGNAVISEPQENATEADPASIAVLPFADLSPEGDQEYFADGMAEEILNALAKVDSLRVASRTSAFGFKGQEALGVPAIARRLKVRHVLEGSIRKSGDTVRVTAQLIDAQTDQHLWSETFDRTLSTENLFAIQDEIANAIVDALASSIGGAGAAPEIDVKNVTDDVDAYGLYLQARSLYHQRNRLDEVLSMLEEAVERDPEFARAWGLRAAVQGLVYEYGYTDLSSAETTEKMKEFAERALAIDPDSPTALASLALRALNTVSEREERIDWAETLGFLDRALELEPNNGSALNWRGLLYTQLGRLEDGMADFVSCSDYEPAYTPCRTNKAILLMAQGRPDEAYEEHLEMARDGAYRLQYGDLALFAQRGDEASFLATLNSDRVLYGWRNIRELYDAYQNLEGDHKELAHDILRYADEMGGRDRTSIEWIAATLGVYEVPVQEVIKWHPSLAKFRQSNRFKKVTRDTGVVDYWLEHGWPEQCRPVGDDDFECE